MLSFMSPLVHLAFLTRTCLHDVRQFLHFHDSGLFVGQFGTLSQFGSMGLNPQIPGDRGGEFETFQYVPPPPARRCSQPFASRGEMGLCIKSGVMLS